VGQQRLHKATKAFLDAAPGRTVEVEWKPFQINPSMDEKGVFFKDYCQKRWGDPNPKWLDGLKAAGLKDGAPFGNMQWVPNTMKAHQLIHFCASKGISSTDRLNALLFRAEYEEGENIALVDVLVRIGEKAASEVSATINAEELKNYLATNEGKSEVQKEINVGRRKYGISGVPHFVITAGGDSKPRQARPYSFSGAQSPEAFVEIFEELAE